MKDKEKRAYQLGLRYLSYRPRTTYEVSNYLIGKGYEEEIIDKVLEKLLYYKYVDDKQYTKNYILSCIQSKKKSAEMVKLELIKKGVFTEVIDEYITFFTDGINLEIAKEISIKYFYQKSNLPFKQLKDRLTQLLIRRRFSWEVINSCLNFLEDDKDVQSVLSSNKEKYKLQAAKLAKRYLSRYGKNEDNYYILQQKIKQALYRRGYDMSIINTVVDDLLKKV